MEAWFALAVCGELCEVSCRLVFLPFSCPLLMLWMGKVEQGATFSNLEMGIKEQLAGQPPWIKQGNLAKDLVFKHLYKSLVKYRSNCLPPPFLSPLSSTTFSPASGLI